MRWKSKKLQDQVHDQAGSLNFVLYPWHSCTIMEKKGVLDELHIFLPGALQPLSDNKSAICMINDPAPHGSTKHMKILCIYYRGTTATPIYEDSVQARIEEYSLLHPFIVDLLCSFRDRL